MAWSLLPTKRENVDGAVWDHSGSHLMAGERLTEESPDLHRDVPRESGNGAPETASDAMTLNESALDLPAELLKRLTNGEYILQFEIPAARLALSNHVARNLAKYSLVIDDEYDEIFKQFGVNETVAAKAKKHLASIQHARVEAEAYLIQLDEAKAAYDKQMLQLLGPEQYRAYRETETARPAMRELEKFEAYFTGATGFAMDMGEKTALLEALKKSQRIPMYDGPYGQGVRAVSGREKVLAALTQDLNLLQAEFSEVARNLSESRASEALQSRINDYYFEQVRAKQEEINLIAAEP